MPGDDRFGVALHSRSKADNLYFLEQLGVRWYLDLESDMSQVPDGAVKVPYISVPTSPGLWESTDPVRPDRINELTPAEIKQMGFVTRAELQSMAKASPGSYWYISGEPNRKFNDSGQLIITGTRFAPVFHYFATELKLADPTAKIMSPSLLNWDFVCIGCAGYQLGAVWTQNFIEAYFILYPGKMPPVDVWSIDVYPIDWLNTPNNDPSQLPLYIPGAGAINFVGGGNTKHSVIATQQLVAMRDFLDNYTEYTNTPIWVTEVAVHVAYDDWQSVEGGIAPVGTYHWDKMRNYIVEILDWMDINAETYNVGKWFFYKSYRDVVNVASDGYMGISLFTDPDVGTVPNCLGETYRRRSLKDLTLVTCDADGKVK